MGREGGEESYLAFDLGASAGRAVLGWLEEGRLVTKEVHRFENVPVEMGGVLYWDVLSIWREMLEALRRAAERSDRRLGSVGVDAWGVDFALLDQAGRLVNNPVHYRDRRTAGIMARVFALVPREKIFAQTGIQFLEFNTLFQLAALKLGGWSELERAATFLMMPDLFHYLLAGRKACEFTAATTSQLYNPRAGDWAEELITALELPRAIFPEIIPPGTIVGALEGEAARAGGGAVVIAPASHDTASAVAAVPVERGRESGSWAYLSSGTWSLMGVEVESPVMNDLALSWNFTNEGGVGGRWRFLKNIAGLWFLQECRRLWSREEGRQISYEEMEGWARLTEPFGAFIDVDHPDFLRPPSMPQAIADFCRRSGQPVPPDKGSIVRVILESLAMKYAQIRERLGKAAGIKIEVLHVIGGGSQNQLLNQLTADALGIPVMAGPVEATAWGNLMIQMMAAGIFAHVDEARQVIRRSFPLRLYEPERTSGWERGRERFECLLAAEGEKE